MGNNITTIKNDEFTNVTLTNTGNNPNNIKTIYMSYVRTYVRTYLRIMFLSMYERTYVCTSMKDQLG